MDIQSLDENFVTNLKRGVSVLVEDCVANIEDFWNFDSELECSCHDPPDAILDKYLDNKIITRDQLRSFIDLLEKYRSEKYQSQSIRKGSESEPISNRSDSPADFMDSPFASERGAGDSLSRSHASVISSLPGDVFDKSFEEMYVKVYKVETIDKMKHFQSMAEYEEESACAPKQDLTDILEKLSKEITLSEIYKHLNLFTSEDIIRAPDHEKFLDKLQKRSAKDKDELVNLTYLCEKEIVKQKRKFCMNRAYDIYNVVSNLKEEMKAAKAKEEFTLIELPKNEVTKSDMEALLIALHEVMHKIMSTDLDFIRSVIEKEFENEIFRIRKLEMREDESCIFAYNQSTETIFLSKCMEFSIQLTRRQKIMGNLTKVACSCILNECDKEIGKVALDLINILKKPRCKPDYVEIQKVFTDQYTYVTIKRAERPSKCSRGRHLPLTSTTSADTLAGAEEIKDECKDVYF